MHYTLPFNGELAVGSVFVSKDPAILDPSRNQDIFFCELAENTKLSLWLSNAKLPNPFWRRVKFCQRRACSGASRANSKFVTFHPAIKHPLDIHFAFMERNIRVWAGDLVEHWYR